MTHLRHAQPRIAASQNRPASPISPVAFSCCNQRKPTLGVVRSLWGRRCGDAISLQETYDCALHAVRALMKGGTDVQVLWFRVRGLRTRNFDLDYRPRR